jgi:hypothetical protein
MAGFTTQSQDYIIRSNLWSTDLKDVLEDELFGWKYVRMVQDFPDGDTLNIPSIGQMEAQDYAEDQQITFTAMETGNFTFQVTEYKASGTYVTDKMKQDSYVMSQIESMFVPKMHRAIAKQVEVDILAVGPINQTSANPNTINNAAHRWVGHGLNETISVKDFEFARYALMKANVPTTNLIAIFDPSCEVALATLTNIVNVSNNPMWQGVIAQQPSTGMRFKYNIFGWDCYISNNLHTNTASETIDLASLGGSSGTAAAGVNNLFFSATPDVVPFIGQIRQSPKVEAARNMQRQRDEYVTTMRYGVDLYRPENLVVIVTDTDQVYA